MCSWCGWENPSLGLRALRPRDGFSHPHQEHITRKSKTEAVLQRRSMLKLGVICKYMKRYGKC